MGGKPGLIQIGDWSVGGVVFITWAPAAQAAAGGNGGARPSPMPSPPTHLGVLVSSEEMVEAVYPNVRITSLANYLDDDSCRVWVRRPQGETKRSMEAVGELARSLAGRDFERGEITGQVFDLLRHTPSPKTETPVQRLFCGELGAAVLLGTERFRMKGLPPELLKKHPASWTPEELDACTGVWE